MDSLADSNPKLYTLIWVGLTCVFIVASSYAVGVLASGIARAAGKGKIYQRRTFAGYFFASPWIVGFILFVVGPAILSLYWSFTDLRLGETPIWTPPWEGWGNYIRLLTDDDKFGISLSNSLYMTVIGLPLQLATAFGLALLVSQGLRGEKIFRMIYYLPIVLAGSAAVLIAWRLMLNPNNGLINGIIRVAIDAVPPLGWFNQLFIYVTELSNALFMALQRGTWTPVTNVLEAGFPAADRMPLWHTNQLWSKPSIVLLSLWSTGTMMLIYLAALKGIPQEIHDAAAVDGASSWQKFFRITFPLVTPATFYNLVVGVIATLQIFDQSYVLTRDGGPAESTYFVAYYLWRSTFRYNRVGYGAAMSWILMVIILVLTLIQFRLSNRWVYYEGE